MAAVPLGDRRRPLPVPEPGTEDRVDERDREVGGEELVGELVPVQRDGATDRIGHLADFQGDCS